MLLPKLFAGTKARALEVAALLAAVSLVACAAAFAQSGRRQQKRPEIAPVPTPTPEPTPLPKDDKAAQRIPVTVVADDANHFWLTPRETDTVHGVAVARLREARALEVAADERRASRGEAMKRAKESKRHVVWLELRADDLFGTRAQRPPPDYFRIDYTVFEPGTAKPVSTGVVHLRRSYTGPLGRVALPTCYPTRTHEVEYAFAAIEVAERIMKFFALPIPPLCP